MLFLFADPAHIGYFDIGAVVTIFSIILIMWKTLLNRNDKKADKTAVKELKEDIEKDIHALTESNKDSHDDIRREVSDKINGIYKHTSTINTNIGILLSKMK